MRSWVKKTLAGSGAALVIGAVGLVLPVKAALAEEAVDDGLASITPMSAISPTLKEIYDVAEATRAQAWAANQATKTIIATTDYMSLQLKSIGDLVVSESRTIQGAEHGSTRTQVERARVAAQKAFDQAEVNKTKLNEIQATEVIVSGKVDTAIARANASVAQAEANRDKLNSSIAKTDSLRTVADSTWTKVGEVQTVAAEAASAAAATKTILEQVKAVQDDNFAMIQSQMEMGGQWEESAAQSLQALEDKLANPACDEEPLGGLVSIGNPGGVMPQDAWFCNPRRAEQIEQLRQTKAQTDELGRLWDKVHEGVAEAKKQVELQERAEAAEEHLKGVIEGIKQQQAADAEREGRQLGEISERLREISEGLEPSPEPSMPADLDGTVPGAGKIGDWFAMGECLAPAAPPAANLCGYGPEFNFLGNKFKPLSYCGDISGFGVMKPLIGAVFIIGAVWVAGRWLLAGIGVNTPDQGGS